MENVMSNRLLTTRRGTMALGIGAAVLAGIVLLAYLNQYRNNLANSSKPVSVLVASNLIEKGTPGDSIGAQKMFEQTSIPQSQLLDGAIADLSVLRGRVAVDEILPGQQLTLANFSVGATTALSNKISRTERAIAVPVDSVHGLTSHLTAGDRVDVFAGFNTDQRPVLKVILRNALVLAAPAGGGGEGSQVVLKADYQRAAELAFAADNGKIWLVLRPPGATATETRPALVTVETMLFGVAPVTAYQNVRNVLGGQP
jgi:Flp pilus assembly protein CpaB